LLSNNYKQRGQHTSTEDIDDVGERKKGYPKKEERAKDEENIKDRATIDEKAGV
jgi:hypothetical protein